MRRADVALQMEARTPTPRRRPATHGCRHCVRRGHPTTRSSRARGSRGSRAPRFHLHAPTTAAVGASPARARGRQAPALPAAATRPPYEDRTPRAAREIQSAADQCLSLARRRDRPHLSAGSAVPRSTNGATKLREPGRNASAWPRLNKPLKSQQTTERRYRTQEVAGSSPASSTHESPAHHVGKARGSLNSR